MVQEVVGEVVVVGGLGIDREGEVVGRVGWSG